MLSESEARARILGAVDPGEPERVSLDKACGRFAAEEARARVAVPGFDNSAMDGYAVRAADTSKEDVVLRLLPGGQAAGRDRGYTVPPGGALRIFTGAPMPGGADAVVMQEDVTREGQGIRLSAVVEKGAFVRRAGSDLCPGQLVLRAGERLTAARCGILASQGWDQFRVGPVPSIGIVTTGCELRPPGPESILAAGELYNSNGPMLGALAWEICGGATRVRHWHAPDESKELRSVLHEALRESDVVIVSGGVSVGAHDLVKPVLGELGVSGGFWRVRVKPGKPLFFGTGPGGVRVFGLPGNPVSSFVTFVLFVRPALLRLMGAGDEECAPPGSICRLDPAAETVVNPGDRPHYVRGCLDAGTGFFRPLGLQQSHALFGLSRCNALLRLSEGQTLRPGEPGWALLLQR